MSDLAKPSGGRKRPEMDWERETMVLGIQSMREGPIVEYDAPGAAQKWRARDLVDIHWKLVGEDPPSESYNRIMSCIIGHANPTTGRCQLKQKLIAAETGYSRDTVIRAVNWWEAKGFLIRQTTGRARSNAYHPQWELFELHYLAVENEIKTQKESWRCDGTITEQCPGTDTDYVPCSIKGQHACSIKGQHDVPHHGATHESQSRTSKDESHPEWTRPPSAAGVDEEGIQKGEVESASTNAPPPEGPTEAEAGTVVSGYCQGVWHLLEEPDFDAAVAAELRESGAGRAAIAAAVNAARLKGDA